MATEAESRMNEVLGGSASKEYKARFRSLAFNLKDPKNPVGSAGRFVRLHPAVCQLGSSSSPAAAAVKLSAATAVAAHVACARARQS